MEPVTPNWLTTRPTPQMMGAMLAQAKLVAEACRIVTTQAENGNLCGYDVHRIAYIQYPVSEDFCCLLQLGPVAILATRLKLVGHSVELGFQGYPDGRPDGWPEIQSSLNTIAQAEAVGDLQSPPAQVN